MWQVRLAGLLLLVGLVLAIVYLPPWVWLAVAAVVVLAPLATWLFVRWKVRRFLRELEAETPPCMPPLFAALFKLKGSVLRKARVTVHAVEPVEAPPPPLEPAAGTEEGQEGEVITAGPPRDYYLVDMTVQPTRRGLAFQRWQPGELALTTPDSGWQDADDACEVLNVQVEHEGVFGPESDYRYVGPQRLRLLVGVRPGVSRLAFRYYTERFGEVALPATRSLPRA
jgi:hypothetical protein